MTKTSILAACNILAASLLACGGANARPAEVTSAPVHDERHEVAGGWEKLGERTVEGKVDHDVIGVGRADGKFTAIQVQVDGSALEMFQIVVHFGDGQTFKPETRLVFDKNTRSRTIDLPGDKRVITKVEFKYGNLPGGGRAKVELWGKG